MRQYNHHYMLVKKFSRGLFWFFLMFAVLGGPACKNTVDPVAANLTKPVALTYWRPFDGQDAFGDIIARYNSIHPNVRIDYRQIRPEIYESELINAMAEDRGPDIFSVHNNWIRGYTSKLLEMPDNYKVANIIPKGGLEGKTETQIVSKSGLTPRQLQSRYIDVALQNMVLPPNGGGANADLASGKVYGIPLFVDTMMLFYNRELLQQAGITHPAINWVEFQEQVQKLTVKDENGKLVRPGAVIGCAENVPRSQDLLALIMMQAGAEMYNEFGFPTFHENTEKIQRATPPGIDALRFYIDFSMPDRKSYTWNALQPDGLEAFMQGRVAYFFGYAYQLPLIRARAPKLDVAVAPVPQQLPNQPINVANFWLEGVSKKSANPTWAWDFLLFAQEKENVKSYLDNTKKPTALLDLIDSQKEDLLLGSFAEQLLTTKTWYRGKDGVAADLVMSELITLSKNALEAGDLGKFDEVVKSAVSKLTQTMN